MSRSCATISPRSSMKPAASAWNIFSASRSRRSPRMPSGVDVAFEQGPHRRFDLVIGADGLHSNIRGLVFGPESRFATWIGAYLAVASVPNYLDLQRSYGADQWHRPDGRYLQRRTHGRRASGLHVSSPRASSTITTVTPHSKRRCCASAFEGWGPGFPACSTRRTARRRSISTRSPNCAWIVGRAAG